MKLITLYLPEGFIESLDDLVKARMYSNRSKAIRVAIRDFLNEEYKIVERLKK